VGGVGQKHSVGEASLKEGVLKSRDQRMETERDKEKEKARERFPSSFKWGMRE
jgi:hypothetical protein